MADSGFDARIAAVRRFNRFYTTRIGVLGDYLDSPFSLTEARVLYELAHRETATATELGRELHLDAGYLSRIVKAFEQKKLLRRARSEHDGRQSVLALTGKGHEAFAPLHDRSRGEIGALLRPLSDADQARLIDAMRAIERLLGGAPAAKPAYLLRTHQPGDVGWVVHRHGVLYAREYGFDERFEALVATLVARFVERFDGKRERCWIAERDGENVGSVFLVKKSETVAQLRLLLVEPTARGSGLGARLVDECIRFARGVGYRKVTLWTNSVLRSARKIYQAAGFTLVSKERHRSFGQDLVGETWDLAL
jgi:DNA-binding MarR family transcriptional regulator/N-acetylglutamate synthase-like GNAT family acetyltransferase